MLIDTHAHLNFKAFQKDAHQVIERSLQEGIWMINVGSQYSTSQRAVKIAEKYDQGVYAAVGLHPIHLFPTFVELSSTVEEGEGFESKGEDFDYRAYKKLAQSPKVVAIGETGFDWYHLLQGVAFEEVEGKQKEVFEKHLQLAQELNLPVILHCRGSKEEPQKAYERILEMLEDWKTLKGVIHCFGADKKIAQEFLNLGFLISFTGVITFPNAGDLIEVVKEVPLAKMMVETDSPYLAPQAHRGQRNEPSYVKFVAEKIAEVKKTTLEEVAAVTTENARRLFGV